MERSKINGSTRLSEELSKIIFEIEDYAFNPHGLKLGEKTFNDRIIDLFIEELPKPLEPNKVEIENNFQVDTYSGYNMALSFVKNRYTLSKDNFDKDVATGRYGMKNV
jgi:hypothetical protein